jgi:hypothetical protein
MAALIRVTQEHIKQGMPRYTGGCPVALACRDAGLDNAYVGWEYITWGLHDDPGHQTIVPPEVQGKINLYDERGYMQPFEFTLDY